MRGGDYTGVYEGGCNPDVWWGEGDAEVWRTSFIIMPRPEDFKTTLHFMYTTCTDQHI